MPTSKIAIRDGRGYISQHDYKQNREPLYRARLWRDEGNVDKYLQTDSYRRLAKYTSTDLVVEEVADPGACFGRTVVRTIRTIPAAQVQADAARASTRAERRARGLLR